MTSTIKQKKESFEFKDLSLLEKFLVPIGVFSLGVSGSLGLQNFYEPSLIAGTVATVSILGADLSIIYRTYKELKDISGAYD